MIFLDMMVPHMSTSNRDTSIDMLSSNVGLGSTIILFLAMAAVMLFTMISIAKVIKDKNPDINVKKLVLKRVCIGVFLLVLICIALIIFDV